MRKLLTTSAVGPLFSLLAAHPVGAAPVSGLNAQYSAAGAALQSGLPLYLSAGGAIAVEASPRRTLQLCIKRVLDVALALLALIGLLPLFAIIALLTKATSREPVIFSQTREGMHGRLFAIYKFRTMDRAVGLQSARVTRFGRLLRRTSMDELPQLLNVLRGEMSLVGPRPHVPDMQAGEWSYRQLVPYYDQRLAVLPGLTGWAQVNGLRGPTVDQELARSRIDHDIAYIQNFSLWLDVRIIAATLVREFLRGTGS